MIKNILFYSSLGLTVLTVFYYFSASSSSGYTESITKKHEEQQRLLTEADSLSLTKKLKYFVINEDYITTAKITTDSTTDRLVVHFAENQDTLHYLLIAHLNFKIRNKPFKLTLFQNSDNNDYILPFTDSTNTISTHSTGRYLPIDFHHQDYIEIDFNMAYNPYCAYHPDYDCVTSPIENKLHIKIEAGQLKY